MEEFDREGLPLLIMANWRGFSGGQRDLFEGILQSGSQVQPSCCCHRHPGVGLDAQRASGPLLCQMCIMLALHGNLFEGTLQSSSQVRWSIDGVPRLREKGSTLSG